MYPVLYLHFFTCFASVSIIYVTVHRPWLVLRRLTVCVYGKTVSLYLSHSGQLHVTTASPVDAINTSKTSKFANDKVTLWWCWCRRGSTRTWQTAASRSLSNRRPCQMPRFTAASSRICLDSSGTPRRSSSFKVSSIILHWFIDWLIDSFIHS